MNYVWRVLGVFSQIANIWFFGGHPNESISARSYREDWTVAVAVINAIFFWQRNHCREAYEADLDWARAYIKQHKNVVKKRPCHDDD